MNTFKKISVVMLAITLVFPYSIAFAEEVDTSLVGQEAQVEEQVIIQEVAVEDECPCILADSLGDTTIEGVIPGTDPEGYSLQDVFTDLAIDKNVITDQKQYQVWYNNADNTKVKIEFLSRNATINAVLGYHLNG